jgi:pyruvate formate lyase activating enzyme
VEGLIFDIQGHSVHDGPGCRTLIFLSGCPLSCYWCANPEGMAMGRRLMLHPSRCPCIPLRCLDKCPHLALTYDERKAPPVIFNRNLCGTCGYECVNACYNEALEICGRYYSIDRLMEILSRDRGFWGSGGGMTLSGGDPLLQHEFSRSLLKACQERYIHTAVETSAYAPEDLFLSLMAFVEWAFIDIKHMDPRKHAEGTGVSNGLILGNIESLAKSPWKGKLVVRVPVIPGFNDDEVNMGNTADFVRDMRIHEVNLLPFHRMGESKYRSLGMEYRAGSCEPPSVSALLGLKRLFRSRGVECYIGHDTPF